MGYIELEGSLESNGNFLLKGGTSANIGYSVGPQSVAELNIGFDVGVSNSGTEIGSEAEACFLSSCQGVDVDIEPNWGEDYLKLCFSFMGDHCLEF